MFLGKNKRECWRVGHLWNRFSMFDWLPEIYTLGQFSRQPKVRNVCFPGKDVPQNPLNQTDSMLGQDSKLRLSSLWSFLINVISYFSSFLFGTGSKVDIQSVLGTTYSLVIESCIPMSLSNILLVNFMNESLKVRTVPSENLSLCFVGEIIKIWMGVGAFAALHFSSIAFSWCTLAFHA